MKRKILLASLLVILLCLAGCAAEQLGFTQIQISLVERSGCTVLNNGQWTEPGEDVVFLIDMEDGYTLSETDYSGDYTAVLTEEGHMALTLENVMYPTRINLELTSQYAVISYDPNGAEDEERTTYTYDLTYHLRPNTSNGAIFTREGYTLVSWNTEPDGSGQRIGLGSRVTVERNLTLYAQWAPWTDASEFTYSLDFLNRATINSYLGDGDTVVIPERIDGHRVTQVGAYAFRDSAVEHVVLPPSIQTVAASAFSGSALRTVTLFDTIQTITDSSFAGCDDLQTLYINSREAPYGYVFRKESMYADKMDILILAQDEQKMVFYAGCTMWYNLDGASMDAVFGEEYTIVNVALNGAVNSNVQLQMIEPYLRSGDVFFHTPEIGSENQLMALPDMTLSDDALWCGIENNYDLFAHVDLRTVGGVFDSLCDYLNRKDRITSHRAIFTDEWGHYYLDEYGCIPFERNETRSHLPDRVRLSEGYITEDGMGILEGFYDRFAALGVRVYVSHACINMTALPADEVGNVEAVDARFRSFVDAMDSATLISTLEDFLYTQNDFYDTNFHMRSQQAYENTQIWIRDLLAQMVLDGLWEGA